MKVHVVFCSKVLLLILIAPVAVLTLWQVSDAQEGRGVDGRFRQFDRNNDGQVTPSELPIPALFDRLDRNGDRVITLQETREAVTAGVLDRSNAPPPEASANTEPQPADPPSDDSSELRQGPVMLKATDVGVGRRVDDCTLTDIEGNTHRLSDFSGKKAVVVALTSTGCPLCLKYAPTLAALEQEYAGRGVAFLFVNPNGSEKIDRLRTAVATHGFVGPYVQDSEKRLPRLLSAETTTEVFVLDAARTLAYRGAVDDQYGFAYSLDAPRRRYLTDALDAVLAGRTPQIAATSSPGCELFYDSPASTVDKPATVTYHNQVSRIIQANCLECHREDGIAPIALETFEEVKDYAGMIQNVLERQIMPPWFAAPLPGQDKRGDVVAHWSNERSLSETDRQDIFAWIASGAPEGDRSDAPLPRQFSGGWSIGKPDAVFEFSKPVQVKATGTMPYQNITVDTDLPEDKWVQAIEVRPGNASVVHHVIVSLRSSEGEGGNSRRDPAAEERSGYWGVYVPGNSSLVYPDGFAKLLPKGTQLRFQMHYTPNGTATEDSTRIGLIFAKEPPQHEVKAAGIVNARISIPPGAENHQEVASLRLPHDVQLLGFLPHMHLRGKAARYEVLRADGAETLLDIPRYDFNWQLLYRLAEPITLRQGDTIRFTAWYDNSAANPANPDPTRTVRWGPQTDDEMHLGYVEYIVPGENPAAGGQSMQRAQVAGAVRSAIDNKLFARLDVNQDGVITREEVRERMPTNRAAAGTIFDQLDDNGDGHLDKAEFSRLEEIRP